MTINAKTGSITFEHERAQAGGHGPVLISAALKPNQGVLPCGLLLAGSAAGAVSFAALTLDLGDGDGTDKTYAGSLTTTLEPGLTSISDGVETFSDDGCGRLSGAAGGSGTVDYSTGAIDVTFHAAPTSGASITATAWPRFVGVLNEEVDTANSGSGLVIPHGTVRRAALKVGAVAQAAPDAATLTLLSRKGVWAV